jgi:hypothetical protein
MGHETEAACLLRTGNLYSRRVGLANGNGALVFAGVKHGAFSLYFGDEPYVHFDLEGRWQRTFRTGTHYRKALDGSIDAIDRHRERANLVLHRRALSFAEATDLDALIRDEALEILGQLGAGGFDFVAPPAETRPLSVESLRDLLERVARWDAAAWFAQRETYLGTYGPLPFLPPDAHQSIVLQATLGHSHGVTFGLASAAESYVRSAAEFEEHAQTVARLLGRRIAQNRSVFLAGSDVLRQPFDVLTAYLEVAARVFPVDRSARLQRRSDLSDEAVSLRGIDAFLDDYRTGLPDRAGWTTLRSLQLGRVNLGVESGDPLVRQQYGKTWGNEELINVVADLKAAEIELGLILLVGAGGAEMSDAHVASTLGLVNSLDLGRGDLVYLVDANDVGALPPGRNALDESRLLQQQAILKQGLEPVRTARGAKVALYRLEKEWN